jgi:hypothetical protein
VSDRPAEEEQAVRDQVAAIADGLARAGERIDVTAEEPASAFLPERVER